MRKYSVQKSSLICLRCPHASKQESVRMTGPMAIRTTNTAPVSSKKDCVYHNRRVITERRCRFPKHHSTKRNHQHSFQQGNPTKNGILAKQIIKADKGISILPTMVAKRNSHKQKFRQKADKQHHFLAYKDINSIHPYIEPGSAGAIKGQ